MTASPRTRRTPREADAKAQGWVTAMKIKVQIAKKQTGLTDDVYRAILRGRFGVDSSTQLDPRGLSGLLHFFRTEMGWQEKPKAKAKTDRGTPRPPRAGVTPGAATLDREALLGKVQALLSEKGNAEGSYVSWNYALAILKRQGGPERLDWATPDQLRGLIAALDKDARRKGRRRK